MNTTEFNNWLNSKNKRLANPEERIQEILKQIERLANGENIDIVLNGGNDGKEE